MILMALLEHLLTPAVHGLRVSPAHTLPLVLHSVYGVSLLLCLRFQVVSVLLGRLFVLLGCDESFARAAVPRLADCMGSADSQVEQSQLCSTILKTLAGAYTSHVGQGMQHT